MKEPTDTTVVGKNMTVGIAPDGVLTSVSPGRDTAADSQAGGTPHGFLLPGLRDAHLHPVMYAASLVHLNLKLAVDIPDVVSRIAQTAASRPGPITALRLDDESLRERRLPTRHDLDAAVSNRPVLIHRYCGHVAVANSAALALAGLSDITRDPAGGSLDRDEAGRLTGVLRETAIELVGDRIARETAGAPSVTRSEFLGAMTALASIGLTSIGAMVATGEGPWSEMGDQLEVVLDAAADLPLKLRLLVISQDPDHLYQAVTRIKATEAPHASWLGVKIFADGSLGGHTAFMHERFADLPTTGQSRLDPARDGALARTAIALGGMVAIHAIGDRAVSDTLDLFTELIAEGAEPGRLRIEHASVIRPGDIERFARLGVIASVQPSFLASEVDWLEARVGPARLQFTYPFRALADAGVTLAGGSDCPVEPPHPLLGIAASRDRCGIVPSQGLDAPRAVEMFTKGAARALGEAPPLAIGSPADLVMIDTDPYAATPAELRQASVLATWVDGKRVDVSAASEVWAG